MKKSILILCLSVFVASCIPQPVVVVSGTTREAINPELVKVYNEKNVPSDYEIVASMNVKSDASFNGRNIASEANIKKLKESAAKIGANGLLIGDILQSKNEVENSLHTNATAIYVK